MALNGAVNTTAYDGRYLKLNWSATQSIADNKSIITWELVGAGDAKYGYYTSGAFKVVIGGITVLEKDTDYRIDLYKGTKVASGTVDIAHNADGTKAISITVEAAIYERYVNKSGSGTFTLDAIPRAATITSAPNFNDEENPTINYSNILGNSVSTLQACISFDGNYDTIAYRDISKTINSYTFILTDAERNVIRQSTTTANSRRVYFIIKTIMGGNTYYSKVEKTLTIINAPPVLNPTITDTNPHTLALTGDANILVRNYSNANITFGASGSKGATITSLKVVNGGSTLTADGTINNVEGNVFHFTVEDSRGNVTKQSVTKKSVQYTRLTCNLVAASASLADNNTTTINYELNGNFFVGGFGKANNTLTLYYRIKANNGSWQLYQTSEHPEITNNAYSLTGAITGLDYTKTYTVEFMAQDAIFSSYGNYAKSEQKTLSTKPVFDWSDEDFNFNVPISINGAEVLRHTAGGNSVLGAVNEIYLRPSGFNSTTGEVRIKNDGSLITSKAIPIASGGTGATSAPEARTSLGLGAKGSAVTPIYIGSNGANNCTGTVVKYQNNTITTSSATVQSITINGTIIAAFITMRGANNNWAMNITVNNGQEEVDYSQYGRLNSSTEMWGMSANITDNKLNIARAGGGTAAITCYVTILYIPATS